MKISIKSMKDARESLGMTQAELARELDVDQAFISKVENGRSTMNRRTALALEALIARKSH